MCSFVTVHKQAYSHHSEKVIYSAYWALMTKKLLWIPFGSVEQADILLVDKF